MKKKRGKRKPPTFEELLRKIDWDALPLVPEEEEKEPSLWELFLLGWRRPEIRFTPREGERFVRGPNGLRLERIPRSERR